MEEPPQHDGQDNDRFLKAAHTFEFCVICSLVLAISLITVLAAARLYLGVYNVVLGSWDTTNLNVVQALFGMVMTVLIALELGNSILRHLHEQSTIIQVQEVILIGMMAVVRKVMIVDLSVASPWLVAALGVVAISLASAYWLMRDN